MAKTEERTIFYHKGHKAGAARLHEGEPGHILCALLFFAVLFFVSFVV
jgi:hypothetical protein